MEEELGIDCLHLERVGFMSMEQQQKTMSTRPRQKICLARSKLYWMPSDRSRTLNLSVPDSRPTPEQSGCAHTRDVACRF